MRIAKSFDEAKTLGAEVIIKDSETEWRCYFAGEIQRPVAPENPVPQEVDALQGLKAIDAAGLSAAYEAWANDPKRKFLEKASGGTSSRISNLILRELTVKLEG